MSYEQDIQEIVEETKAGSIFEQRGIIEIANDHGEDPMFVKQHVDQLREQYDIESEGISVSQGIQLTPVSGVVQRLDETDDICIHSAPCKHMAVETGGRHNWCKYCDVAATWCPETLKFIFR